MFGNKDRRSGRDRRNDDVSGFSGDVSGRGRAEFDGGAMVDVERLRTLLPQLLHQAEANHHRFRESTRTWRYDVDSSRGRSRMVATCVACSARVEIATSSLDVCWDDSAALLFPCLQDFR
jgi:hypothetical protein